MVMVTDTDSMNDNLSGALPMLLPLAVGWADGESRKIRKQGKPLAFWQFAEARQVGVRDPRRVRILLVDAMPQPANSQLLAATMSTGILGPETEGLSLGYGILILRPKAGERRILRHELRHVAQYEAAGSLSAFLDTYLDQIARFGYWDAPLEVDARSHERRKPSVASSGKNGPMTKLVETIKADSGCQAVF